MFRTTALLLLNAMLALVANAAIDLTAMRHEYVSAGITYQELILKDGNRIITMELPRGWAFRSSSDRLQLTPPQTEWAEGVIQAVPLAAPQPLDEAVRKALVQQVRSGLPPNSQVVALEERENTVIINGNESLEVLTSYQAIGYTFQRSTIFVNCPEVQLIFRFTAPKTDFESLNKAFRRAIMSWNWRPAKASEEN